MLSWVFLVLCRCCCYYCYHSVSVIITIIIIIIIIAVIIIIIMNHYKQSVIHNILSLLPVCLSLFFTVLCSTALYACLNIERQLTAHKHLELSSITLRTHISPLGRVPTVSAMKLLGSFSE